MGWPNIENDFMEYGDTGWVSAGNNQFINVKNGHYIDENGIEYDADGVFVQEHDQEDG